MDGFSYVNIFDTKGIEYLVIIAFLLLLIPFWVLLNKDGKITKQFKKAIGALSVNLLKIPQGVFHSKNHTWTFLEKSGNAKVGVDELVMHITGELKCNTLKLEGELVSKGDLLAEIEHQEKSLKVYSPISGSVVTSNRSLLENPGKINIDPYGDGWMYEIKPQNWKTETQSYYLAEEANKWSANELQRFKDFIAACSQKYSSDPSLLVLQDGGELSENVLSQMPDNVWRDFQAEFLDYKV